jgi:hypothetical protein
MPFFLDGNPTQEEVSEAINYLLGNTQQTTSTNVVTGQVTDATGSVISYLYKYLDVKYADSFDGTVNFTNTPASRLYYGLRNNDSSIESTDPADYIWYQVTGGFGTTKQLFYSVTGGRRINIVVSISAPSGSYQPDTGPAIDLDQISGSNGSSSRICYAKSTSTSLSSIPATYQTSGPSSFPPTNTWGGGETWQATPYSLAVNEALFQSDGIYNPTTDLTTWNSPYLSTLKVGSLSAISANLGTITAGSLNAVNITGSDLTIGSSPAISGTSMTGTGSHIYNDGRMVVGNSTNSMVFDGTTLTINGNIVAYGNLNGTAIGQIIAGSINFLSFTSSGTWTVPSNVYKAKITLIGGGGGGSTGGAPYPSGGGGAGGALIKVTPVTPGQVLTITIGNGGAINSNGGASTVTGTGISLTANGGGGGASSSSANPGFPGVGGTASGGDLNYSGSNGAYSGGLYSAVGGFGGSAALIGRIAGGGIDGGANTGGGGGGLNSSPFPTVAGVGGSGLCIIEY